MTTERLPHARPAQSTEHENGAKVMSSLPSTPSRQSTPTLQLSTSAKRTSERAPLRLLSYNISNHTTIVTTGTTTTTTTTTITATTTTSTSSETTTLADVVGTGGNTVGHEQLTKEFYRSYDPSTGLHTAAVLGSILVWLVLYVIYRTKVRRCLMRVKRRFEGGGSISDSSLNTNNNTNNWNNKNTSGIEEPPILGEEDLYPCMSDGGQGSGGKKASSHQPDFSDSISNSGTGTGTGTNPNMVRSAFINPSIVIETSPTDSLPLSPGACTNAMVAGGCHAHHSQTCSGMVHQKDGECCCEDDAIFQFPCPDNEYDLPHPHHNHYNDENATAAASQNPYQKQKFLRNHYDDHHNHHHHHHHHHHQHHHPHHRHHHQQDDFYMQTYPQQLPKSVLDIPSATARWVQNMPLAMRSFQDLTGGSVGFGAFRLGGLYQSTLGPMGAVYKPCSCPMVCPLMPQQPLQPLQQNVWNNNSMPVLPGPMYQAFTEGAESLDYTPWEERSVAMGLPGRRNENAPDNLMDYLDAKRKKMKRRRERRKRAHAEGEYLLDARRVSSRDNKEHTLAIGDVYSDQKRRHTLCVADVERDQSIPNASHESQAKARSRNKAPPNLTISIPNSSISSHNVKNNSINSPNPDTSTNRRSPVPLPVTPTVTIQNSCGSSYHHRRHTSIASVSSSSSDLMMLPVPLPVACSQPISPPPQLPSFNFLSSSNRVLSSPSRLPASPSCRKTPTSPRVPSPHLLHPLCEGGKGKSRSRSLSPVLSRSCCSTPCLKDPATAEGAPLSPAFSQGSKGGHGFGRACSSSLGHREAEHSCIQSRCSFKLTRPRKSSSSSSKQSGSEKHRHLPRSGSGLNGDSRPRGWPDRQFHCSPSEGHLASIASQDASPTIHDKTNFAFLTGGMYCNRRCLSDLHSHTNTDLSPTSPLAFDRASCSLSPTSSLPSSKHRCGQIQHQRSMSAAEMMTSSSRPCRDDGGASPTWSNPSTRTSQGGGASSYSHSPSPNFLQVPENSAAMRPATPDNSVNIYNNNGNYSSENSHSHRGREPHHMYNCQQRHNAIAGPNTIAVPTPMRHSVMSDSNLAYYKSQLYVEDDLSTPSSSLGADIVAGRRNSTFTHSTGKINLRLCDATDGATDTGECSSNTTAVVRPSSSFGSSSSYGSSLHPHHHPPQHHHNTSSCCRQQQHASHHEHQTYLNQHCEPPSPTSPARTLPGSSPHPHQRRHNNHHNHHHSMSLLSPTDNENARESTERLTASSHNINASNINTSATPQQNINTSLSSRVMETKL